MDIISWLTESASVNRHVSPLYFIIVSIITLSVLFYALKTDNRRAVRIFVYAVVVWLILEFGLFFTGVRQYNLDDPYLIIMLIGGVEDPGWVCLAYIVAERMMKVHRQ
jgi:Na+/melibiose symporter-like transporter